VLKSLATSVKPIILRRVLQSSPGVATYQLLQLERAPDWVGAWVTAGGSVVTGACMERETSWERKRARTEVFMMAACCSSGVRVLIETRDGHILERAGWTLFYYL
jgi:hypothetical protein